MAEQKFVDRYVLQAEDRTKAATASAIKNFEKLGDSAELLKKGLELLGVGLTLDKLKEFATGAVEAGEKLGNTAEKIGITAEQLQVLRLGAEQNGSSAEKLDKAMVRLATNIGDAGLQAQGLTTKATPAADALKLLGINVLDAGGNVRQAGDLFPEIIDKLAALPDAATRAGLAAQIFGKKIGPELAVMINAGSGAFEKLRQYMVDTGALISNDTVEATRELADQFNRVGLAIKSNLERGFLEAFAGEFRDLDEAVKDPAFVASIHDIGQSFGGALRSIVDNAPQAIQYLEAIKHLSVDIAAAWALGKIGIPAPVAIALSEGAQLINASTDQNTKGAAGLSPAEALRRTGQAPQADTRAQSAATQTMKATRDQQVANETAATARLSALRQAETTRLQTELDKQKAALKDAVEAQRAARQQQQDIAKEFADLVATTRGPATPTTSSVVLDTSRAQSALSGGDTQKAIDLARQASDAIAKLDEADRKSATIQLTAQRLQQIANAAAQAQAGQADQAVAQAQAIYDKVSAQFEALKNLPVGFAAAQAITDAQGLRAAIEAALAQPIVVPVTVAQVGGDAAPTDAPARAYGGRLPGSSPNARADNLLFWGTAGELLIGKPEADAIQRRYGSAAIAALLQGRLPANAPHYAVGGLLDRPTPRPALPALPAAGAAPRGGDTINLTLPGGNTYTVTADRDTSAALARDVRHLALKSGNRTGAR